MEMETETRGERGHSRITWRSLSEAALRPSTPCPPPAASRNASSQCSGSRVAAGSDWVSLCSGQWKGRSGRVASGLGMGTRHQNCVCWMRVRSQKGSCNPRGHAQDNVELTLSSRAKVSQKQVIAVIWWFSNHLCCQALRSACAQCLVLQSRKVAF